MQAKYSELVGLLRKYNINIAKTPLATLLEQPGRFQEFSRSFEGILLDFSRVQVNQEVMQGLLSLARAQGLESARERFFNAEIVNLTEHRPAMHMALRDAVSRQNLPPGEADSVQFNRDQMLSFASDLHSGVLPADRQQAVTDIVHIGIGGSLLGTRLIYEAFAAQEPTAPAVHFLGSVDAYYREKLLARLDPRTTVVILVSKSFSTADTLMHGARLREWLTTGLGPEAAALRMFGVSGKLHLATAQGVPAAQVLNVPDWVGGRFSLWSPVSLSAAAVMGPDRFKEMLAGAASMDRHFAEAELENNLPVLFALLGIWHRNFCGFQAWGVIPYDQRLRLLPAFLQQLIMESTGKSIRVDGSRVAGGTAPVVFGECGTDAQHSLFQAMHQGVDRIPLNLLGVIRPDHSDHAAHAELMANLLAQAQALANGRSAEQTRAQLIEAGQQVDESLLPHRVFDGNRPTEILLLDELTPAIMGRMLALFEHKVFVESVIWEVNAFDQWGVELGKSLAPGIRSALEGKSRADASLEGLLGHIRQKQTTD